MAMIQRRRCGGSTRRGGRQIRRMNEDPRIPWSVCDMCGRTVFKDEFRACRWRFMPNDDSRLRTRLDACVAELYGRGRLDLVRPGCQPQ
jgi:hypothetical protein